MAPSKMKLRVKKRDAAGKSSQRLLADASPESKCPICLDGFNNVASLDRCLHQFCFRCIHEWSKNKAECPLCKQPFHSIIHSVKGENDFKEFVLPQAENGAIPNAAAATPAERVLRPRALRGRERRSHRLQPPVPSSSSPLDDNVMFGGLSDAAALTENQDVQQMVLRLTARRRGRGEGRSLRRLRDQDVVAFRRALYRTGVRVRNTRDAGRQRDVSAAFLRQNPACLRRLLPWLQRELTVLYGSHGSLVNIVQHIIMSRITNYNMEDAAIRDELRPFLLARTDHFLHELVSFARSTLSMEVYDQQAIYDCPAPSYEEGSSSDSSVIAISEGDDENDSEDNITASPSAVQECLPVAPAATESLLSESAWDDETPGPSYSTLLPSSSQSQDEGAEPSGTAAPPLEHTDPASSVTMAAGPGADDEEEEECLIVGYVKPMAERTPELVQLSSDSSEEEQEAVAMDTTATVTKTEGSPPSQRLSQSHIKPLSPTSSPSPAPSGSPQQTPSEKQPSRSRERVTRSPSPSSRDQRTQRHRRRSGVGSRSHSLAGRESSGFSGHRRRKGRLHQHSANKEYAETYEPSQPAKCHNGAYTGSPMSLSCQSPAMSVWSGSRSDRSPSRNDTSSVGSPEHSHHKRERHSQSSSNWERERGRRRRERRSPSPESDAFVGSHRPSSRSRESPRSRKRRRRSVSSSSADSRSERSRLDKPGGKRKYKTRHLERAAQRQQGEGPAATDKRKERPLSRSPSVEIIYERKAPEPLWHQRKKRRHRKRKRELRSPTIITIDSDSDRTIDCLDRVLDVIDQTAADMDEEKRVGSEQTVIQNAVNSSSSSSSHSFRDPPAVSPGRTLNLDHCVVDVVDHSSSDALECHQNMDTDLLRADNHTESVSGPLRPVVSTTTPPSDTRLLESILQDLEEFLPGVEREAETNLKSPLTPSPPKNTVSPQWDQSNTLEEAEGLENRNTNSDEQRETEAS